MRASEITRQTRANERRFRLMASVLVALMLACAAATVVTFLTRLVPAWQPWYLVGVCLLVSLDTFYNHSRFKEIDLFSREWLIAVGAQLILLFIGLRVVIGGSHGLSTFWGEVSAGWREFLNSFLSVEYFIGLGMCILTWLISLGFAGLFEEMGIDAELIRQEGYAVTPGENRSPRERLLHLVFSVGAILVLLTGLLRLDFRAVQGGIWKDAVLDVPSFSNGGLSTLLYFLLGLALFSLTHWSDLNNRWSINRIPSPPGMLASWAFYSLLFLTLLTALVSLLPTTYSLGFLASLGYLLNLVIYFLFLVVQFLVALFLLLMGLLSLLFGQEPPVEQAEWPAFQPDRLLPEVAPSVATPVPWVEVAKSFVFWGLFLFVLVFALVQYLRLHEQVLQVMRQRPSLTWLFALWERLRFLWKRAQKEVGQAVKAGLERIRPRREPGWSMGAWLSLRKLTPRQTVFFYYHALLRRSSESGLARHPSQTPAEFAVRLDSALPEAEPDVEALTGAFIEARYAPQPVQPEQASRAREIWEHLRKLLRKKKTD
ncbi:MAG: hypothetical protein DDG60_02795 [Anaerolineae bacterium]|nr:MAG: hypothetical protein DDG60_02795 [Anaerolineae bacterium]